MRKVIFTSLFIWAVLSSSALAADFYVDAENGVDNASCSEAAPCATIDTGLNMLSSGGTLHLAGTFEVDSSVRIAKTVSGTEEKPTTIQQWQDKEQAVLSKVSSSQHTVIFEADSIQYVTISGLEFAGNDVGNVGLSINGSRLTFENNTIHNYNQQSAIFGNNAADITFNRNTFYNVAVAVNSQNGDGLTFTNNIIYNVDAQGVLMADTVGDITIANNTFYNQERVEFIRLAGFSSGPNVTIVNNIFSTSDSDAYAYQFEDDISSMGSFSSNNNIFYLPKQENAFFLNGGGKYSLEEWQAMGYGGSSLSDDPEFIDIEAGDFHISSSSPALETGTEIELVTEDFDGEPRPYKDGYDIGADEYPIPYPPAELATTDITQTTVAFSWMLPSSAFTSLILNYGTDEAFTDLQTVPELSGQSTTLEGLNPGTTYYACIYAEYITDYQTYESGCTEIVSFTTTALDYSPAAKVKKLKVKKKLRKRKRATTTWKKHSYVTVLKLQKWNKKKKKYKKHKTFRVKKNKKKKVMKKLKAGTKYRVRARKRRTVDGTHYFSDWTKWVKFRTKK